MKDGGLEGLKGREGFLVRGGVEGDCNVDDTSGLDAWGKEERGELDLHIYIEGRLAMWSPWRAMGAAGSGGR